jgi:hypothetical protein
MRQLSDRLGNDSRPIIGRPGPLSVAPYRARPGPRDGNWDAISIDSNPLLRRPSKLFATRFPTPRPGFRPPVTY